jgi:hypothetical protein
MPLDESATRCVPHPATFADIHASLGETDQAVDWYRNALADRSWRIRGHGPEWLMG